MQNSSSNNLFGSFNNQGNNTNKGIFGNANVQSNLANTDHSSIFGASKTQQSNNALVNKNIFNMSGNSTGLGGSKSIYDNTSSHSNLGNKNIFGSSNVNSISSSQGNMGGNNLFMNSSNQNNLNMKNIFGGTSNINTQGSNLSNKSIFGGLQQNAQNTTSNNLFGNLSSSQTNSGSMFGNLSPGSQNKGNSLFGTSPSSNQTSATSNMFGNASTMNQNKSGGLFGNLQSSNQGTTSSSMFGGLSSSQGKTTAGGNLFGAMSAGVGTGGNTGTNNLFGNSSTVSQNKPGGIFGNLQSPTQSPAGGNIFGNSSTLNQNKGNSLFSAFSTTNQASSTSNMFGNASTMNQNKSGGLFGNLQSSNQGTTNSSMFGGLSSSQGKTTDGSNLFGGMSTSASTPSSNIFGSTSTMNQNKAGGVFGTLQSPTNQSTTSSSSMFGGLSSSQTQLTTGSSLFGGMNTNNTTSSNNIFGNAVGGNQSKTSSNLFGSLSTSTQPASTNLFGGTTSSSQGMTTSSVFSSSVASGATQNKFNNIFGQVSSPNQNTAIPGGTTGIGTSSGSGTTSTLGGVNTTTGTSNIFGNVSSAGSNINNIGDNKNILGTSSGFSVSPTTTSVNPSTIGGGIGLGSNLSTALSQSLNTNLSSVGNATNASGASMFGTLGGGLNATVGANMFDNGNLGTGLTVGTVSPSSTLFLGDKNISGMNMITQETLLVDGKIKDGDLLTQHMNIVKEDVGGRGNLDKLDEDLTIIKRKESIFDKAYDDDIGNEKEQGGVFYNHINLIINDNINDIQKTTFSLLNDYDSYMWDNFKSSIFKNFVDYIVNFKQKKNQKLIKSNVLDLDQHEFQILIWLYNVNSYKIDFIPFKSFYYLLLSDTNLNYSKMLIGNSDNNILFGNFVEINDHYYMNSQSHFFKTQINKHHHDSVLLSRDKNGLAKRNSLLDIDSIYKQNLKDILNSLLNMNLSIMKENFKKREKEEYYENNENSNNESNNNFGNNNINGVGSINSINNINNISGVNNIGNNKDKFICMSNYTYENLLLNYLFGTLQHLHDKFYKIEITNYVSKDLNQVDDYFVDAKSNAIFSYCYDNFYKNEMDKEYCTIHFFFYLTNIMFRCGNYIGLIQIIKNEEFVKNLCIDRYLYDFVILLIRILLLLYNKNNEISILENMNAEIDCCDILKKKINMSNLINFFHSIIYLCVSNIYAYDLLCILFSDIFYKKGNMYINRERKIEMKNIFHYTKKKKRRHVKNYEQDMEVDNSYMKRGRGSKTSEDYYSDDIVSNDNYSGNRNGSRGIRNYSNSNRNSSSNSNRNSSRIRNSSHNINNSNINNHSSINRNSSNNSILNRDVIYQSDSRNCQNDDSNYDKEDSSEYNSEEERETPKSKGKAFFFDMFTNILQKPKKPKEDPFGNIELNEEIDKINRDSMLISNIEILGITNRYAYNFEYCNIETSIWIELTLFVSKNFDLSGSKFQENFDIFDTNLSFYNYDDDNNAFLNDTKYRREKINNKIEKLFTCISSCIIHENKEYFSICSKLKVDDVINNFIVEDGKISEKVKGNISKVLNNNFLLYIKLFYYLLLVGNLYITVAFLSCISNNVQRILLVLTIFLHKNNIFENAQLNNIKTKTLSFLKFQNENTSILDNSHDINDDLQSRSDKMNLVLLSMNNHDIPFDYFLLQNNNINILLKITYLLNLKTNISIKLLKSIVQQNQDILLHENIIGQINNDGNIYYGKLHDFLFLFKNKIKIRKDVKCFFLMYYILYKKKSFHNNMLSKKKSEIDEEYHYKCRNFKFVQNKNINTLNRITIDNSIISVHASILYKISQFYAILAYFANQRKNYIISFICYYILKDEQSAINSLIRIYNDELIYYYHNSDKEYSYIRKCAFRFYHLAKNMWPSNIKLESVESKSYLVMSILLMKRKMYEEAYIIFSSTLIPDNMLEKLSTADYYNIDLSSNFLMTLRELCRKNYRINELVGPTTLHAVVKFLLPIKDKLDAQVIESINYLGKLSF
ncbi:nucleoporin NUP100/NSP100, putative [Plasmodium malariae]|uniref:Nucleoporin NUP100/NSP100, putative n=1 Tax=Plasmodium malariae TaxID=5858 RepID=A0A1D3JM16_PLAMA|nr:nucleoporin NUP100/NSP100, putative [Plasmodium malariae]SBT87705.1 nucleoporin NUP100/NSP100, putative [Plasmodium malariae]